MLSIKRVNRFVPLGLLLGLTGCSDATQFTEKTQAYSLDAANDPYAIKQDTSLDPTANTKTESTPDVVTNEATHDGIVYEGSLEDTKNQEAPKEPSAPEILASNDTQSGQTASNSGSEGAPVAVSTTSSGGSNGTSEGTIGGGSGTGSTPASTSTDPSEPQTSPAPMLFSDCVSNPSQAIVAQVYELPVNTSKLPDFSKLIPAGDDVCLPQLNISERIFSEGFPGVPDLFEWFGLDINFKVEVPSSGNYSFTLKSDDGAILYIDGQKIVDNDGTHATKEVTATKNLSKGFHSFHIKYYQGPRYHIALELFWKTPGALERSYIPEAYLSRP